MAPIGRMIEAELTLRTMLEQEGVPEPDVVEYGEGCIRALWYEPKVALVVDLDAAGSDGDGEEVDEDFDAAA